MSVDAEPIHAPQKRRDDGETERTKDARRRGADTRRRRTRTRAFLAYLRIARTQNRQITVAQISKRASISQAAFYENFKGGRADDKATETQTHGIAALLTAICAQIAKASIRELHRQMALNSEPLPQPRRVAITSNSLVHILFRYPNVFNVEGKIPREVIIALSAALTEAITGGETMSDEVRSEAEIVARYHTTAIIGILRSGLGANLPPDEYMTRLIKRTVAQIIPALSGITGDTSTKELTRAEDFEVPALLRITSLTSYTHLMDLQASILQPVH